jgi:hypothetical protein
MTARAVDPSPPDSPDGRPSTGGASIGDSRSSLQVGPTGDRTPSTYLDELMSNGVRSVSRQGNVGNAGSVGWDREGRRY